MSDAVLSLRSVHKRFSRGGDSVAALADISISLRPGVVTGLIGPDGAGKTTLMRVAAALLAPERGQVEVLGMDPISDPAGVQSAVGYMPQRFGLYEDLSVQENLALYADLQGLPPAARAPRYATLLRMTGMAAFSGRLAGKLSGGMKQKLGLACTLLRPPQLLLLDEPTVGVDPISRRELWAIVYSQVRDQGMTVLLSTAYLDEAARCEQVILLHQGKLLGQDSPASFSTPLDGRVFRVSAKLPKRRLQTRLREHPGVVDALIEGGSVRVVLDQPPAGGDANASLPALDGLQVQPLAANFEDAFVSRLAGLTATSATSATPATLSRLPPDGDAASGEQAAGGAGAAIQVQHLERRFGSFRAVKDVSFSVQRGEVFGLLGANGAGKSTTFRMLCGLLPASAGQLAVAGLDLRHAAAKARARIGYMAQRFALYGNLGVVENLRFFASAYGLSGRQRRQRIDWALDTLELRAVANVTSEQLPLGYKQRLALAAALMHQPEILFLDEPTSGVDPLARREFWNHINALAESGVTVLVTTHFMDEANYCDRLVIMADGAVLAQGSPEDLRASMRSDQHPDPSMEEAFIGLIEQHQAQQT
jgi:ABC-2 type transport system ATP-binding protein